MIPQEFPVYVNKTHVSRSVGVSIPTIERLMAQEIIIADAWLLKNGRNMPIFLRKRVGEIVQAVEKYNKEVDQARMAAVAR